MGIGIRILGSINRLSMILGHRREWMLLIIRKPKPLNTIGFAHNVYHCNKARLVGGGHLFLLQIGDVEEGKKEKWNSILHYYIYSGGLDIEAV
jgi:hypothetical protein